MDSFVLGLSDMTQKTTINQFTLIIIMITFSLLYNSKTAYAPE